MAFSSLSSTLIQVGRAIKAEIFSTLKSNQDDLNTRVSGLESGAAKVEVFNQIILPGGLFASATGIFYYVANIDFDLVEAKLSIGEVGSGAGTIEVNLLKGTSLDSATYSTVFSTRPSIDLGTANDYDSSTNAVFSSTSVSQGDFLRIDITSFPTTAPTDYVFTLEIYGEAS